MSRLCIAHCNQSHDYIVLEIWVSREFRWCLLHENLPFQYCNHVIDCSVECAIGARNLKPLCCMHAHITTVSMHLICIHTFVSCNVNLSSRIFLTPSCLMLKAAILSPSQADNCWVSSMPVSASCRHCTAGSPILVYSSPLLLSPSQLQQLYGNEYIITVCSYRSETLPMYSCNNKNLLAISLTF